MSLLRRMVYNIGPEAFDLVQGNSLKSDVFRVDGEDADFAKIVQEARFTRVQRLKEYYHGEKTFAELVVLTHVLDTFDSKLLYPLLGDLLPDKRVLVSFRSCCTHPSP